MILSLYAGLTVPDAVHMEALDAFSTLVRARRDLLQLQRFVAAPWVTDLLDLLDNVVVVHYERMIARGQGLEAASLLDLYSPSPIVRTAAQRVA